MNKKLKTILIAAVLVALGAGVGAYAACMEGLLGVDGAGLVTRRLASGRPVLGICVGHQVLFDGGTEHGERAEGVGLFEKAPVRGLEQGGHDFGIQLRPAHTRYGVFPQVNHVANNQN